MQYWLIRTNNNENKKWFGEQITFFLLKIIDINFKMPYNDYATFKTSIKEKKLRNNFINHDRKDIIFGGLYQSRIIQSLLSDVV